MGRFDELDELVRAIGEAGMSEREALRDRLLQHARSFDDPKAVIEHLEHAKRSIQRLEARWEVDEVIELITPPPVAAPEDEEEEGAEDPDRPLTAADLELLYDDPRGLQLHRTKKGERYFFTQIDRMTMQPQTFELRAEELSQLKAQLAGSPYWIKMI